MVVYHCFWFAEAYGFAKLGVTESPWWQLFQKCIAYSFFFLVGTSLLLAHERRVRWSRFAGRAARIGLCALVVTVTSALLYPAQIVRFGTLHCILVSSLAAVPLLRAGQWNWLLGSAFILASLLLRSTVFDHPFLSWIGLGSVPVSSFDFQPFLPSFGVVVLGIAAGGSLWPRTPSVTRGVFYRVFEYLGRKTLLVYMAHVPVLVATMELIRRAGY